MNETGIAWARYTLNPIVGCSHISDGCQNCYAEGMATTRLASMYERTQPQQTAAEAE